MRIALGVEYDGSQFQGWQILGAKRTVQAVLQDALARVADHPVKVCCAGRTDSGVHAVGQVVHFDTLSRRSERAWVLGVNTHLPSDVSVTWAGEVSEQFHARYAATGRSYRYVIFNRAARPGVLAGKVTWEYRPLNAGLMQEAALLLIGEHDFSAFRARDCQSKSAVRNLRRLEIHHQGELVVIEVEANAFLYRMVRNIAGVLMAVGMGRAPPQWAREVLESCDRTRGGVTAAADGLYLTEVSYPPEFAIPRPSLHSLPS